MLTSFPLLAAVGLALRCALNWGLSNRWGLSLTVPQILAGALIVLAGLPDLLKPFAYPLPLSFTLGVVLPDLFLRRK
ncbi:hypothetical protein DL239_21275 [Sedimentitalea sp. CY04]|uniref:Uncharacterized protein n=1 Tax=Parasedimentitalea denitrificans TaxID=2211118 RepID=A0ABX0WFN4_9RHOB|nr:hypothetical protein [Sedimentitalea sp. CY04]NIZ63492.1 hypothetical protein [Sedimentitalea sp. CY04]